MRVFAWTSTWRILQFFPPTWNDDKNRLQWIAVVEVAFKFNSTKATSLATKSILRELEATFPYWLDGTSAPFMISFYGRNLEWLFVPAYLYVLIDDGGMTMCHHSPLRWCYCRHWLLKKPSLCKIQKIYIRWFRVSCKVNTGITRFIWLVITWLFSEVEWYVRWKTTTNQSTITTMHRYDIILLSLHLCIFPCIGFSFLWHNGEQITTAFR